MTAPKIVVTRQLSEVNMEKIRSSGAEVIEWTKDTACDKAWLLENIQGATGLLCMFVDTINEEVFAAAGPSLKVVSTMSVGTDHIALESAWKRGVLIGFTPDILTDAVADLTVLLALFAMRRGKEALLTVQAGKWPSFSPYGLAGQGLSSRSVLGFLGFGRIAQATLQRMLPFGPKKCLYSTRTRKDDVKLSEEMGCVMEWVEMERLARESDVVFVLCNGGEETKGLVGEEFLGRMKKTAVLVNTARGTIVDSVALLKALQEGSIFAAGLDVVEGEPNIAANHPLVLEPRCAILPHVGSATFECRDEMGALCAENLLARVFGRPIPVELKQ